MTKEQIQAEIQEMDSYIPVSKIEESLGMPPTTLQKVLKGKRELPKKWVKVLEGYFVKKVEAIPESINEEKEELPEEAVPDENKKLSMRERIELESKQFLNNKNK